MVESTNLQAAQVKSVSVSRALRGQVMMLISQWSEGLSRVWSLDEARKLLLEVEKFLQVSEQTGLYSIVHITAGIASSLYSHLDAGTLPSDSQRKKLEGMFARLRNIVVSDQNLVAAESRSNILIDVGDNSESLIAFVVFRADARIPKLNENLRALKFEVVELSTVKNALEALQTRIPDLVIVDDDALPMLHQLINATERVMGGDTQRVMYVAALDIRQEQRVSFAQRAGADSVLNLGDASAMAAVVSVEYRKFQQQAYRVLTVDDEPMALLLCRTILETRGMQVHSLREPAGLMEAIGQFKPDLVLLDLHMPNVNGIDLAMSIREHREYENVPIVFLSAEHDESKRFVALRAGGDDFLLKPIQPGELISVVENRIRRARVLAQRGNAGRLRERRGRLVSRAAFVEEMSNPQFDQIDQFTGLCLLGLNRGQDVFDQLGFIKADQLTRQFTDVLSAETDLKVLCAGGDACLIALINAENEDALKKNLSQISKRIELKLCQFLPELKLSTTLVVVRSSNLGAEKSIQHLYELGAARFQNRISTIEFDFVDHSKYRENPLAMVFQRHLRARFNRDALRLEYQPLIPLNGQLTGQYRVRCFLRQGQTLNDAEWNDPESLKIARHMQLVTRLDRHRVRRLLQQLQKTQGRAQDLRLHMQISLESLFDEAFAPWLQAEVSALKLDASQIGLQFDVDELIRNGKIALQPMRALQMLGVRVGLVGVDQTIEHAKIFQFAPIEMVSVRAPSNTQQTWTDSRLEPIKKILKFGKFVVAEGSGSNSEIGELLKLGVHYMYSDQYANWRNRLDFDFKNAFGIQ